MRNVGTASEVLASFARYNDGGPTRTASAQVPGGCRLSFDRDACSIVRLRSYRTTIAERRPDGTYLVGMRKYSITTSGHQSALTSALYGAGMAPAGLAADTIQAAVPGRWGGYGIPWHATGWETVPAILFVPADDPRAVAFALAESVRYAQEAITRGARAGIREARRAARAAGMRRHEVAPEPLTLD